MSDDQPFLWEMLYQSLYVPEGHAPIDRIVLRHPYLARYVEDWGRKDDCGFIATDDNNRPLGATWMRLFKEDDKGYGYIDDLTPELGMAVQPEYRGQGIGTALLVCLIKSTEHLYNCISLSVASGNPAARLYTRLGFEITGEQSGSITMKGSTTMKKKLAGRSKLMRADLEADWIKTSGDDIHDERSSGISDRRVNPAKKP